MVPSIFFAAFGAKYVGKKGSKKGIVTWTCVSMAITSVLILFFIFTDTRQIGVIGSWNMIVYGPADPAAERLQHVHHHLQQLLHG